MNRRLRNLFIGGLILLILALVGGMVWANSVYARAHAHEKEFLVPWLGAQTFLRYGENPYAAPAAQRNQVQYYGRLARKGEDPLRLGVPFPLEMLYFPFALIPDYGLARGVWMTLQEIALAALAILTLRLIGWKGGRILIPAVILFSLLWVYALLALQSGSWIAVVALAIVGALLSLRAGNDELAGAIFLLPFYKPDMCGVFMLFMLWWIIVHRRGRVVGGFLLVFLLTLIISFVLLPSWFVPFLRGAISDNFYNLGLTPGGLLASWWPAIGGKLALGLTVLLAVIILLEWRLDRGQDFRHTLWTVCVTLSATPLLGIPLGLPEYVILFLPVVFALALLAERWSRGGQRLVSASVFLLLLALPWAFLFGRLGSAAKTSVLFLGLPFLLLLLLYWERWWAIRPPRTWLETIKHEAS